ncbi:MAG: hypothetical protein K0Q74_868 [Gammaproteobacteria bacterium]|nr:hypothetical protein [Gammaproteobacteria bacterium]
MLDNSLDYFSDRAEAFLADVWGDRDMGIPTPAVDWTKPPTRQMVASLLRQYPYLQVVSSEMEHRDQIIPKFKKAPTGWVIHDYDQAMSVSLGRFIYQPWGVGSALLMQDEDSGEGEGGEGGKHQFRGGLLQQSFDTADAVVAYAIEKGWPGIQLVSATEFMTWSLWMATEDRGYKLVGFDPRTEDKKKRLRVLNFRSEREAGRTPSLLPGER